MARVMKMQPGVSVLGGRCVQSDWHCPNKSGEREIPYPGSRGAYCSEPSCIGKLLLNVAVQKANSMLGMFKKGIVNTTESIVMLLYKTVARAHPEWPAQIWSPHLQKEREEVEKGSKDDWGMEGRDCDARGQTTETRPGQLRKETLEGGQGKGLQNTKW